MHQPNENSFSIESWGFFLFGLAKFLMTWPGMIICAGILVAINSEQLPNRAVPYTSNDADILGVYDTFNNLLGMPVTLKGNKIASSNAEDVIKACVDHLKSQLWHEVELVSLPSVLGDKKVRIINGAKVLIADVYLGTPNKFYSLNCLVNSDDYVVSAYIKSKSSDWASLASGPSKGLFVVRDGRVVKKR